MDWYLIMGIAKCDQGKPTCSRCTRLGIACEGGGQQRYKFHNQTLSVAPNRASERIENVTYLPSNGDTMLASAFTFAFDTRDLRFDLRIYGEFFRDIPRRLGRNEALDASTRAITTAYTAVQTRQHSVKIYEDYAHALKMLRTCLNDPVKAAEPDTMCAVYLTMICQVLPHSP